MTKPLVKTPLPAPASRTRGRPALVRHVRPCRPRARGARRRKACHPTRRPPPGSTGLSHLSRAPGRQLELALQAWLSAVRLAALASGRDGVPLEPDSGDRRFADPAWQKMPYHFWQQAFLAQEEWWRSATRQVRGQRPKSAARVAFMARQMLDGISPANVPWLNPVIVERTIKEAGRQSQARRRQPGRGRLPRAADAAAAVAGRLPSSARTSPRLPARSSTATT